MLKLRNTFRCLLKVSTVTQKGNYIKRTMASCQTYGIIKSDQDRREYRGLVLTNKVKVLLVSDPTTDKSAAALDVHVGSMSDPWELPGLAHFTEHMLFMGTEKYPCENEYSKYLSEHSGCSNAYTSSEHTNFYFDVAPDALHGALDRFSQFFISPLFTESASDREVNSVNSEHEKNVQNDYWRLGQLEKSTSKPNHDYSKFSTGNLETLDIIPKQNGQSVRKSLLEFHKKWYSSNIMSLAVLGKESLDEMEELIVRLFSDVENKDIVIPEWDTHPFGPDECRMIGYVVPVKNIRNLNITFPIGDLQPQYKTAPGHYLAHLIGHEGSGSLLSHLKQKGWVNVLEAGHKPGGKGFGFFIINMDLTEDGILCYNEIVTNVFQYLNLLRGEGPKQWIFEECRDLAQLTFKFKDKERPQPYVAKIAELLHYYPMEEVLCGAYTRSEYKPELITSLLHCLTPDNIRLAVIGHSMADHANQKEKWYGTLYKHEKIEEDVLELWRNAGLNESLYLPAPNEFVPRNFNLCEGKNIATLPVLINETTLARVWYKQDDEYRLPKVVFYVELFSPLAYLDPCHTNLLYLFVQLLKDSLTEYTYYAELAGLEYFITNTKYGLTLTVMGYKDKQDIFIMKVIKSLTHFKANAQRFSILKEAYVRALQNFTADQPHQHVVYYLSLLLSETGWAKDELLGAAEDLTVDTVNDYVIRFLSNLRLEFLIHGDITKEKALEMSQQVMDYLIQNANTKPLLASQYKLQREVELPLGSNWVFKAENAIHKSSALAVYFQCGQQSTHANMLLHLVSQILSEPSFDILRYKEQLGYIVWCTLRYAHGTNGLKVIIQGDRSPAYLDSRIEAFIKKMGDRLSTMPENEFMVHREALTKELLERPKKLAHLTARWWHEISSKRYNFDRVNIEVAHLQTQSKADVVKFYQTMFHHLGPERRKLSIHVMSTAAGGAGDPSKTHTEESAEKDALPNGFTECPPVKEPTVIDNIMDFKQSMALFPLLKPLINFSEHSKSKL